MNFKTLIALLGIFLIVSPTTIFALNYYVNSETGNNAFTGQKPTTAFKTLQKAGDVCQAGDTIFVMNGTYTNATANSAVLTHKKSGLPTKWIVYTNYQDHKPLISFSGWHGIKVEGSYVIFNGLTVRGNNANVTLNQALNQPKGCQNPGGTDYDPKFNGNGFSTDGRTSAKIHHLTIRNCTIYECGGSGIQTVQSDYITIENNLIYNNAWYSVFAPSGISLYQLWNYDTQTGVKNIIRNNICHGNRMFMPWPAVNCTFTDGNGIIIDDSKNTQNSSTLGAYKGRTLVINNLVYNNGGSGIHSFLSEHVDIINNTSYQNSQTPSIDNGEIYPSKSADVRIFNNILWSQSSKKLNSNNQNATGIVYEYNMHFGALFPTINTVTCIKADPQFGDVTKANFTLKSTSPAKDKGIDVLSGVNAPLTDLNGNKRPFGPKFDIGAYEFGYTTAIDEIQSEMPLFIVSPNPVEDFVKIMTINSNTSPLKVNLCNLEGRVLWYQDFDMSNGQNEVNINMQHYPTGLYFVKVIQNNLTQTKKIVKN